MRLKTLGLTALTIAAATTLAVSLNLSTNAEKKNDTAAVERTRKTVRMLDDIYKTTVALITDKYVHDEDDFPAGSAAVALFKAVQDKGWHKVRLLDATGKPRRRKNSPKDDFEKAGIAALKSGKTYYEQIVAEGDQRHLRAMTPVPIVSKKCIMCHDHYEDVAPGAAIGGISYTLQIE